MRELNFNGIFDKQNYLLNVNREKSNKKRIYINFILDGNTKMRYKEYQENNTLLSHYIVDDVYCVRTMYEDYINKNSWSLKDDVTIEVLNTGYGNAKKIEENLGNLLRVLYDKFGFTQNKVGYRGRIGKVSYKNVTDIANKPYYETAKNILIHTGRPNLKCVGELLRLCLFKKVSGVFLDDGKMFKHQELTDALFTGQAYYINNIGYGDDKKSILAYIRRFIDSKVCNVDKLKKIDYICYFEDGNKAISDVLALLFDAKCFKDNGGYMSGSQINNLKKNGKLIYIGNLGKNREDTTRKAIKKYLS